MNSLVQVALFHFCLAFVLLCAQLQSQGVKIELKYALFISGPMSSVDSSDAVSAIEIAEETLNRNETVLPGYSLTHTEVVDTMCQRTRTINKFFDTVLFSNQTAVGLLGCGCSVASTAVGGAPPCQYLTVELSEREKFPNFFRTNPSDVDFTPAIIAVIKYYGWKRIAVLTQEEGIFIKAFERVLGPLKELDIDVRNMMFTSGKFPIRELNGETDFFFDSEDYRIFFLNSYSSFARQIICEAYKRGFTYPRYAWLLYGWYADRWWTEEVNLQRVNCTDGQLVSFLERGISVQIYPVAPDENIQTDTGLTPKQFHSLYQRRFDFKEINYTPSYLATVAYDGLWSLAFALDRTQQMVTQNRDALLTQTECPGSDRKTGLLFDLVPLENFDYSNELMGCLIRWNLERTAFIGLSGPVQFNNNGSRVHSQSQVLQYRMINGDTNNQSLHLVLIAFTKHTNINSTVFEYHINQSNDTVYPEAKGGIPPDGTPQTQINTYHLGLVVPLYIIAALGLVFCTACLIFNFTMRNRRIVRLTSPNLNYIMFAGAYIMYLSIFFRVMPSTDYTINVLRCNLDVLMNNIGYCLAFSVVVVKIGRIHYIFRNPTSIKKTVKDSHLAVISLTITFVAVLLSVLQVSVPPLRPRPQLDPDQEYGVGMDEFGLRINYTVYQCFSSGATTFGIVWLIFTLLYLALLQLVGLVLAIQIRKVKIKALNDSKSITALIYLSSIVLLLIAIVQFFSDNVININELVFSGGLLFINTAFLGLLFIPKMVSLYKDPDGKRVFQKPKHVTNGQNQEMSLDEKEGRKQSYSCDQSRIVMLEDQIAKLEKRLQLFEQPPSDEFKRCLETDEPVTQAIGDQENGRKISI